MTGISTPSPLASPGSSVPPGDAAIHIEGVTKRFRDKVAVDNLDLVVPRGSLCGFLGPNGAGKTTTIRMVMAIFYPNAGRISVLGKATALESKDRIGYLPEERGVYRKMKVGQFLEYMAALKSVPRQGLSDRIDGWLERMELPDVRKKKCEELSKGMQQKVQIIATLIHEPELIILDEPFSGLDPVNTKLLRDLVLELRNEGRTVIFSTHVLIQAEQMCDRIFMINKGRKILDGSVDEIRDQFDPKTVAVEFLDRTRPGEELGRLAGVRSVSQRGGAWDLHLHEDADPAGVMRAASATLPVRRVELRRASLEDIFVSLVDPGDSEDSIRAQLSDDSSALNAAGGAA
ncbi:MAG: ABC transporter ATP-binding protein [Phycisphaerales bacterium]